MSVSTPTDSAPVNGTLYCSTDDVARHLRKDSFPTQAAADPNEIYEAQVVKFIEKWTTRIDRRTGQSWRVNTVAQETHDHERLYYWLSGHPIRLMKRNIQPLNAQQGDKIEVWTGNKWEEWLSDDLYNAGRDGDYWLDAPVGILYIYERAILRPHPKFRITYRYGYDSVPADIRDAVAARAAADIIHSDIYGTTVPGNNQSSNSDPQKMAQEFKEQFQTVARDYHKVEFV